MAREQRAGLPRELSSFIGRDAELVQVHERLDRARLVTLTGPGGAGKTRLALRVASTARRPKVQFVELASLTDGGLVAGTIAEALGARDRAGASPVDSIAEAVGDDDLFLIVDNCEHLPDAVAALLVAVLERCGRMTVLATSRQRLQVPGEIVFPVHPLTLPATGERTAAGIADAEAVRLFVERATAAEPTFRLTDTNAPAVAEICRRLDGIPLAIELAAARVATLAPDDLAANLDDRVGLLSAGGAVPPRHQTLRALVQWSYELLDDPARRLLARLSVFRNGFDLRAVQTVASAEPLAPVQTVAGLAGLVDRSLVQVHHDSETRYSLLETIRSFAAERLDEFGETTTTSVRHLDWAVATAAETDDRTLTAERDNLRAALGWALDGGDVSLGRELAARLARWWFVSGRYREGRQFLGRARAGADDEPAFVRARLLAGDGWCAYHLGASAEAEALGRQGLDAAESADDAFLTAWARILLAGLAWSAGDGDRVRALLAGSEDWAAATATIAFAARASVLLTNVTYLAGDLDVASRLGRRAVALARRAPRQENLAIALLSSSGPLTAAGDFDAAVAAAEEGLSTATAAGDSFTVTIAHHQRARVFGSRGDPVTAEAQRCWDVGRAGGVVLVEALAPIADAMALLADGRLADAMGALRQSVAGGRSMGFTGFVPMCLAEASCLAARVGDTDLARHLVDEAEAALIGRPERLPTGMLVYTRGLLARASGDLAGAERLVREAAVSWHEAGARPLTSDAVEMLGTVAIERGRVADGLRLLAAAQRARERLCYFGVGPAASRAEAAAARAAAEAALGDEAQRHWDEGRSMTLDEAVDYARRGGGGRKRPELGWASLTPAEEQVVQLVAEGLRNDAIAERLFLSPGTVKNHLSHVFTKLGLANRAELVAEAVRRSS